MKIIDTKYFATILFLFLTHDILSQEPDPNSFFPHSVGNIWEYDTPNGIVRYEIKRDSVGNDGHNYLFYGAGVFDPLWSIDTTTSTVYYSPNQLNWKYYQLNADSGDTWMVHPENTIPPGEIQRREAVVKNKYPWFIFGMPAVLMEIEYYDLNWGDTVINEFSWKVNTETLASGFGLIEDFIEEPPHIGQLIRGCVIDEDTFGIVTSIENNIQLPNELYLSQNFPNPFNPSTFIEFSLKEESYTTLTIFDISGREVKNLLKNESLSTGTYRINVDASDLPSGVYFYSLQAGDFIDTKKMILMK
ncbi:MAG: T9SS type A sorting domain-containing protein [Ignavibacteria bacterium]|jgi:hypothetical protein